MKLLKIFQKDKRKSYYGQNNLQQSGTQSTIANFTREAFVDYLLDAGYYDLAGYVLLKYYDICSTVADATDRITKESSSILPIIKDIKTGNFSDDHPVLELLKNPNPVDTYSSLVKRILSFYLLTGDSYFVSTGLVTKEPLEFFVANPVSISPMQGTDGFIENYYLSNIGESVIYKRADIAGRFRYYNPNQMQELYQMKRFNRQGTFTPIKGQSILHAIYYEIEQLINSNIYNLSTLKRGASVSGILTTKADSMLTDDQRQKLKEQLENFYSGSRNAGRIGFLDIPLDFSQLSTTNRDMDFRELKKDTESTIYKRFGIPLPFINEQTMTMANRQSARLDFYDDAILPLLNEMFDELTHFLMYRYPDSENKIITFDISKIPALEPRKLEQLEKLNKMNILSTNEQRQQIGYDDAEGGEEILVPMNYIPIGSAGEEIQENEKSIPKTKQEFVDLMRLQTNGDGSRKFTDEEIEKIAHEEGLN